MNDLMSDLRLDWESADTQTDWSWCRTHLSSESEVGSCEWIEANESDTARHGECEFIKVAIIPKGEA